MLNESFSPSGKSPGEKPSAIKSKCQRRIQISVGCSPVFCKRQCTCSPDNFTPAANSAGAGDLLGAQGETHLLNHLPRFSCFPQHLLSFVVSLLGPLGHLMYFLHSGLFWFILALLGIEFSPSSSSRCISCTQLGRPLLVSFEASWQRQCC